MDYSTLVENKLLIAVCIVLLTLVLKNTLFANISTSNPFAEEIDPSKPSKNVIVEGKFTPQTLYKFNGFDLEQIYIAVKGNVYDVSKARTFYGPSGPYSNFAGHDASRGLAKNSFDEDVIKPIDGPIDDLSDLTEDEWKSLNGWEELFISKYTKITLKQVRDSDSVMSKVNIALGGFTHNNLGLVNKIRAPNVYSQTFLEEAKNSGDLSQFAYFGEVPVGLVVSKPLTPLNSQAPLGLSIELLDVLQHYRGYGVEDKLLEYIENLAKEKRHLVYTFAILDKDDTFFIEFYEKKGYKKESVDDDVYKGLQIDEDKLFLKKQLS